MARLLVIAGPAGSGKSTTAELLSHRMAAPHVDFDVATADLVEQQRPQHPELDEAGLLALLREERYRGFATAVSGALMAHPVVIASAPFTSHVASDAAWRAWVGLLPSDTDVRLAWIDPGPQERLARMRGRGSERDAPLLEQASAPAVPAPVIPHFAVAAERDPASCAVQVSEAFQ